MPSVFDNLDLEWAHLAPHRPEDYMGAVCAAVGANTLGELLIWARAAAPSESDRVLKPLVEQSAAGSEFAARVLLQVLLPGTCRLAARWWVLGDADERAALAVAAVYQRIRNYPVDRRPTKVAANILLDAGQDLWRAARKASAERARWADVEPHELAQPQSQFDPDPRDELAQLIDDALAARRIGAYAADLISATRLHGRRLADLAVEQGTPLRTLQWRRAQAEAALARMARAA